MSDTTRHLTTSTALTRHRRAYASRDLAFLATDRDLSGMLTEHAATTTATIVLTTPAPDVAWWHAPVADGWTILRWHSDKSARSARYTRGGRAIEVRLAAPWFGEAAHSPDLVRNAWQELESRLRAAFGDVYLRATPGRTGVELIEASLPFAMAYPPVDHIILDDIRDWIGQGRRELYNTERDDALPSLVCFDARWQYAACVHNLPVGPVTDDTDDDYAGYTPGFYCVRASVPAEWRGPGLLPVNRGDGWEWPARPGEGFVSWASGAEIAQAIAAGWIQAIHRRILWHGRGDPLKSWITRLIAIRDAAQLQPWNAVDELVAYAVRHIVIDAIGYFHRRQRTETGLLPVERQREVPDGAVIFLENGLIRWQRDTPLDPRDAAYDHPEWTATVWSRSRARLATALLSFNPRDLVAARTDAVWATHGPATPLADGGRPGGWRVKGAYAGPLARPQHEAQFVAMLHSLRSSEGE